MKGVLPEEDLSAALVFMPLAARRALDAAGHRLSLKGWRSLPVKTRQRLVEAGLPAIVDVSAVADIIAPAVPSATSMEPDASVRALPFPEALGSLWQTEDPTNRWRELTPVEQFAVRHWLKRNTLERIEKFLTRRRMTKDTKPNLTHIDSTGAATMVSTAQKEPTLRRAVASAAVRMHPDTAARVRDNSGPKGEVLATARLAGIMAAKQTPTLIPLCHGINVTRVDVQFALNVAEGRVDVRAEAEAFDRTGVEMEAMVAASVAALTIYDMLKAVERGIAIENVRLEAKSGGRSGDYRRGPTAEATDPNAR